MPHFCSSNFPDETYLQGLVDAQKQRIESYQTSAELLVMWSGAALNWLGDIFTDPHVSWKKEELDIDRLILTGTNPEWNEILIKQAEKSPSKLREIFRTTPEVRKVFSQATWDEAPILVRFDAKEGFQVFDGMHRAIAGVRDGKEKIIAWVARRDISIPFKPACEPHVVYDLVRAYQIGSNRNREGLVSALRFLKGSYSNVEQLLKERFGPDWLPNGEIQSIIQEAIQTD